MSSMGSDYDAESVPEVANNCPIEEDDEFTKPTEFTDLTLVVEGKQLHTARYLLITASPVFKVMLTTTHFKEKNADKIDLPCETFRDVQLLLKYISPDAGVLTADASERLLPIADKYQIEGLKSRCINCLCLDLKENPDGRLISLLSLTEQLGLDVLKEQCIELLLDTHIDELTDYIHYDAPQKSTVSWHSVWRILRRHLEKLSTLTSMVNSMKALASKHAYHCRCATSNKRYCCKPKCSATTHQHDFVPCNWNEECLNNFARDLLTKGEIKNILKK
ncbi:hypothetical protein LOTGIDRAFT_170454 [Lottia gigantea]|uniref:BTB domain-containing protein n=1 Tax=Lottia gigantea TaxID=225164 RepID=V4B122_LOTGI|nr:hypothetical protein LOTGIDRAFT_170454 [Lottia gigantea]ESO81909.1 hypothetical protein LOTGIDRAFT_170454 [Lottia gigantea]